ncbi:MAG: NAD(P)-dependent oxidoreductase [Eubacterium sp.]
MEKDWTGNKKTTFVTIGASNHTDGDRERSDYYATDPKALELLLELEHFNHYVWECACGEGHLSKVLIEHGYTVLSSDLYDRGYPGTEIIDFLKITKQELNQYVTMDIITNPPYKYAKEFVEKAIEISNDGSKIAMFLKLTFLESEKRKELFNKYPPKKIWVSSNRLKCAKNGDFEHTGSSAVAYAWFIWEKGYKGQTVIEWFN